MSLKTRQCKDCIQRHKSGLCEAIGEYVARRRSAKDCKHFRPKRL